METKSFYDAEFGSNQFIDLGWQLNQRVLFNGFELPVYIEPEIDDQPQISPVQRQALRTILALPSDILEKSAPAVVQNYEVYREMLPEEEMPPLDAPVEVWKLVEPTYFEVQKHKQITTPTFFLWAECDWDPEHGLTVRFKDGHADAASQQGDLGMTD